MRKTTLKTCFCFLDLALAFINDQSLLSVWKYGSKCYTIRKKKKNFILGERETFSFDKSGEMTAHRVIVSCCIKCVKFQIFLKANLHRLDKVKCRNVIDDKATFSMEEIFIGCHPNEFENMSGESGSECEETISFPRKKMLCSCFTQSKIDFDRFCSACQEKFKEEFEPDLFKFSRNDKLDTVVRIRAQLMILRYVKCVY